MSAELPSPGIYRGVPFETYLEWPAISNSKITLARKSLLHYREVKFREPTKAMNFGSFCHCGILEPNLLSLRYAVMPRFELDEQNTTKGGQRSTSTATEYVKAKTAEFVAMNSGKQIVTQDEYDNLATIAQRIADHPRCREWMGPGGEAEVSMVWLDDETGLPCKARIDYLREMIVDLKTTRDAMQFPKSIASFGYHRQAAHYRSGYAKLNGGELKQFALVAIETDPPFPVRAAILDEEAIAVGESEVSEALQAIAEANESGVWTSYEDPKAWTLPAWYANAGEEIELVIGGDSLTI